MKTLHVVKWAALTFAFLCSAHVSAQSLRCNGDLAGVGDSKASVMQKCGKPALTDWYCKPVDALFLSPNVTGGVAIVNTLPCERVDDWTYLPGSGQFVTTFRFERSVVTSMVYGDRIN